MTGIEGAGTLMLIDSMIRLQGLELTLEQIRQVNALNVNFNRRLTASEKKEVVEAWEGLLSLAMTANKKARTR